MRHLSISYRTDGHGEILAWEKFPNEEHGGKRYEKTIQIAYYPGHFMPILKKHEKTK